MAGNSQLQRANAAKNDEFYTQMPDIENELRHYRAHFKDAVVLCNCDDPYESNFFKYFALNFNFLGLRKLITTCYKGSPVLGEELPLLSIAGLETPPPDDRHPYKIVITEVTDANEDGAVDLSDVAYLLKNRKNTLTLLKGDGDFRSDECIELLKQADIVVTNPPFSLFREYVTQLMDYNKRFLIVGNQNAITYKEVFRYIRDERIWLGIDNGGTKWFRVPLHYDIETESRKREIDGVKYFSFGSIMWFTNLDHSKRHEKLVMFRKYSPEWYPKYDNYDAIEVSKVADIPDDWDDGMGVPITYMNKHNPDQFEILGNLGSYGVDGYSLASAIYINGKKVFKRILIRRRTINED